MAPGMCISVVGAVALATLCCDVGALRRNRRSNHTGENAVNSSALGAAPCASACPMGAWDGGNCYIFRVPDGAEPFIWANNFYYKAINGQCPYTGYNDFTGAVTAPGFDGANCYLLGYPGTGQELFIIGRNYYLTPNCWGEKVITLGDSYSSGTGIHRAGSDYDEEFGGVVDGFAFTHSGQGCWREKQTTPGPVYATAHGMQSVFLACKGAENVHVANQMDYASSVYPVDAFNKWEDSVILFTAGGNDIRTRRGERWPELLKRCILEVNPFGGCNEKSDNQVSNWATVQSGATALYDKLARDASRARIRVLGYPYLMQRDPNCNSVTGVNKDEADWMDDMVDTLNLKLQTALNTVKAQHPGVDIRFVDVRGYITIGACGPKSTRQVNDKVLDGVSTSDSSFHPTQFGYDRYFAAFANSLNR